MLVTGSQCRAVLVALFFLLEPFLRERSKLLDVGGRCLVGHIACLLRSLDSDSLAIKARNSLTCSPLFYPLLAVSFLSISYPHAGARAYRHLGTHSAAEAHGSF